MSRILFVDDEPNVLAALKRMLYPQRSQWEMVFVSNGDEALKLLSESEFDVLVTDIRMPGMSGIELLQEVVKLHPRVLRMVLSGTADQEMSLRSATLAHQYLVKPCDTAVLRATVERGLGLQLMLQDSSLKQVVSQMRSLPSVPALYTKLIETMRDPDALPQTIGRIIAQDMGMTIKVLQLVNSALFGARRRIADPAEAAVYLGKDTLRALVLTCSVFSQFERRGAPSFSIEALQDHSLRVAVLARAIAAALGLCGSAADAAFLGGLLHDVGKLVLACNYPDQYEDATTAAARERVSVREAEFRAFGATHAEVGGYLLWLWGLPEAAGEVVARHHKPLPDPTGTPGAVLAVHVADALVNGQPERDIDPLCLSEMGLADRLSGWKILCQEMRPEEAA